MGKDSWTSDKWQLELVKCPQQSNNDDCGLYTLAFATHLVLNQGIKDSIDTTIWNRWIWSIVFETQMV